MTGFIPFRRGIAPPCARESGGRGSNREARPAPPKTAAPVPTLLRSVCLDSAYPLNPSMATTVAATTVAMIVTIVCQR